MADAVSKLYAEIGFKVNQDGLKQAQRFLTSLHTQMSNLNKQTKEMAKQYGIFSKQENAQRREDEKQKREEVKTENERRKGQMALRNQEFREKLALRKQEIAEQRQAAKDEAALDAKRTREEQRQQREREKQNKLAIASLRRVWGTIKSILKAGTGLAGGMWTLGQTGLKFTEPSRQRAMDFRNFGFETGMDYESFRKLYNQFASMGLGLSQQDIMGDMTNIQRNLTQVALGGGNLDTYKLMDIREAARRNDLVGVLEGIRKGIQRNEIDNSMLTELVGRLGVSNPVQWAMAFKNNILTDEDIGKSTISGRQQRGIIKTEEELRKLGTVFENLRDQLTSAFAPSIRESSQAFKGLIAQFAEFVKNGGLKPVINAVNQLSKRFFDWLASFKEEDIENIANKLIEFLSKFVKALGRLADVIIDVTETLAGKVIESDDGTRKTYKPSVFKAGWKSLSGSIEGLSEGFRHGGILNALAGAFTGGVKGGLGAYKMPIKDRIGDFDRTPISSGAQYIDNSKIENTFNVSNEDIAMKAKEATEEAYNQKAAQAMFAFRQNIRALPSSTFVAGKTVNGEV